MDGSLVLASSEALSPHCVDIRLAPILKIIFHQILVASLFLMALFLDRVIRVRLATSI